MHGSKSKNALGTVTILLTLMLAACSGDDGGTSKPAATNGSSNTTGSTTGTTNTGGSTSTTPTTSLAISGAPNRQVIANQSYWFRPTARGAAGAVMKFGISNKPPWSVVNSATGEVMGTPQSTDVGAYHGVTVTVTAGTQMRALSFDIEVVQVGTNSLMISWLAPTENEDGTPLTNLAGYRIRYGIQSGNYSSEVKIDNAGLATYVINGLAAGTYYLVLSAVNANGGESTPSNEAQANVG